MVFLLQKSRKENIFFGFRDTGNKLFLIASEQTTAEKVIPVYISKIKNAVQERTFNTGTFWLI